METNQERKEKLVESVLRLYREGVDTKFGIVNVEYVLPIVYYDVFGSRESGKFYQVLKPNFFEKRAYNAIELIKLADDISRTKEICSRSNGKISKKDLSHVNFVKTADSIFNSKFCKFVFPMSEHYFFMWGENTLGLLSTGSPYSILCYSTDLDEVNLLVKEVEFIQKEERKINEYYYLIHSIEDGLTRRSLNFDTIEVDLKKNYNDDLPYVEIKDFINDKEKEGLVMLYGEPGTGKTTLIRSLIQDCEEAEFYVISSSNLAASESNGAYLDHFLAHPGAVYILEDAEKLLLSRINGQLDLSTILNMTDGIIGNTLKTKFIVTFNTDANRIDPALLRKGRLAVKYEFKKLELEKTQKFVPEAKEAMTLADCYNHRKRNDFSETTRKKIGF